ncbi:DUF6124 family protein, partial [Pseudomonas paracarnis]|uniref:DUF6124 family protein n=1 Tax=Pseudomonas paracarnis TaxID=2750625 RepID=UPI003F68EE88
MIKDSPNPPSDSQPTDQIFTILTNLNSETLLANASQDLASVPAVAGQQAIVGAGRGREGGRAGPRGRRGIPGRGP